MADILQMTFYMHFFPNEKYCILIKISLMFIPKDPIVPFHKDFSHGGEQLKHRKSAHEL